MFRSTKDVIQIREVLGRRSLHLHIATGAWSGFDVAADDPQTKLSVTMLAGVMEFQRDMISENAKGGVAVAQAVGKTLGCPAALDEDGVADVVGAYAKGTAVKELARRGRRPRGGRRPRCRRDPRSNARWQDHLPRAGLLGACHRPARAPPGHAEGVCRSGGRRLRSGRAQGIAYLRWTDRPGYADVLTGVPGTDSTSVAGPGRGSKPITIAGGGSLGRREQQRKEDRGLRRAVTMINLGVTVPLIPEAFPCRRPVSGTPW
ncbi:recombinase family protein [Streptomyces milbemycinicus]|uniref:recombinase family protein n=1 Tax=Streptomyces milbemycinicus TaxID=476552 RepID=UPI0034029F3A